jgi:hypothetical protein
MTQLLMKLKNMGHFVLYAGIVDNRAVKIGLRIGLRDVKIGLRFSGTIWQ